jgi:hypothetical protein
VLRTATSGQLDTDDVGSAFRLDHMLNEPYGQLVGVGDGALPEPQHGADLGPVTLDGAPCPVVQPKVTWRHSHLAGGVVDRLVGDLRAATGEPAGVGEELEQQREPRAALRALDLHQGHFVG